MKKFVSELLMVCMAVLFGCGGSGGGSAPSATVNGVAATGAPLIGTVYLKDSSTPRKEVSTTTGTDGSFSFNVDGLQKPFFLKAVGTSGGQNYTLYSIAGSDGITNINPLSQLALITAAAAAGGNFNSAYDASDAANAIVYANAMTTAKASIHGLLSAIFTKYGVTNVDFVSDKYTADHTGMDLLLDMISLNVANGNVTIMNKNTGSVIYTASTSNVLSGTVNIADIPEPPVTVVTVTPGTASLTSGGSCSFTAVPGTVTWSIVESNGGTITSAGIYTAPSVAGTYHVKATSVADSSKSATVTVTVSAPSTPTGIAVWKSVGIDPPVTITLTSKVDNYSAMYNGKIECSVFTVTNGIINAGSNTTNVYITTDGTFLNFNAQALTGGGIVTGKLTSVSPTQMKGTLMILDNIVYPYKTLYLGYNAVFQKQ